MGALRFADFNPEFHLAVAVFCRAAHARVMGEEQLARILLGLRNWDQEDAYRI